MTVSGDVRGFRPPPSSALALDYRVGPPSTNGLSYPPRHFKKHKVLPHPRRIPSSPTKQDTGHPASNYDLSLDTALVSDHGSQPSSPPALKHRVRRISSGPDPPPTPPTHSRTSSSSHSALPSSPTFVDTPARSTENVRPQPPSTPTNQMSPPTPDVTPPHVRYPKPAIRPLISERIPSKATTDSRTESFKTARENPSSDEEEEEEESSKSTLRPVLASPRTSQSTVRQSSAGRKKNPQPIGLGLGLESSPEASLTPKSRREFHTFDGEWGSSSEVEQEWDDNLERNVTVRKRRAPARVNRRRDEVVEDVTVTPTNAARAVRSLTLPERILTFPSPNDGPERPRHQASIAPSTSESSVSTDARRFSGMSSKSTVSTVVEAILVDTPPRRQKTLRHVKKQSLLRDSALDLTPPSSAPTSLLQEEIVSTGRRRPMNGRYVDARHESVASAATFNSISSGRARREVWKNGAIPVVIVPDRKSSVKSSREPSLRSTSSRRSRRSQSQGSVPLLQISRSKDLTPYFERPTRRGRAKSESDGSTPGDQRTIDYPPVVPRRTSSLSAPTSRNGSRNGSRTTSLTADSVHARNAVQSQLPRQNGAAVEPDSSPAKPSPPEVKIERAESVEPPAPAREHEPRHEHERDQEHRLSVDRHGELFYSKHLSPHNTPFSQASVETTGTSRHSHAEVSEALAVNIYPHQNTSILMVDHRPSDSSDGSQVARARDTPEGGGELEDGRVAAPTIRMTDHDAIGPVTPPQPQFSMDDVDSPLRNPRAPPEPPAIKFIPATPSGLTPAAEKEKQLGNYFDETGDKPTRSKSLVRRVLGGRRHSSYGPSASRTTSLLTRTFSLTRGMRRDASDNVSLDRGKGPAAPGYESEPADETRLHPMWRPASSYHSGDDDGFIRDGDDDDDETYRYPRIDNRPPPPRRSLSSRMKRTFAILPLQDEDDFYPATSAEFPERRTVRRTPSGNLRVVKHRGSLDSLPRPPAEDVRPYTAPEQHGRLRPFWRSHSLSRGKSIHEPSESRLGRLLPGLSSKIGEYSLQSIPRRLSERRREKRSKELRQKISGPREVRDGVGDVIRRNSYRDNYGDSSSITGDA